ncbi:cell envelope integrity protein CreD [Pelagovum pacificum]|uniref:Cell envelope integrity protein CreD n=1 Tax=Pelagovum pacificum TaxID=2588711 RepID=A0A5C5GDA6_9RHOB|nr:cell envelope integrity protein CreD [Pelagovum pacificum]QQA42436.1 cell envelope integrity protein CreD [Pelagovum pacificum]TNY31519.1 cell envelope integrity protein CreD [Pelagovum pacificum]
MLRSAGTRFFIVGVLTLFMFIPLFFVGAIIDERADYSRQTIASIGEEWGGTQQIAGPQLVIPVEGAVLVEVSQPDGDPVTSRPRQVTEIRPKSPVYVYPEQFDLTVDTRSESRSRGIFEVPVYVADADFAFEFDLDAVEDALGPNETILWDQAEVRLGLGSNRALRGEALLQEGGESFALEPLVAGGSEAGIVAAIGDPREREGFTLALGFNGAGALWVAPVGRTSRVSLSGDWPHPSFSGAFLPDEADVSEEGFSARWTIPHLARSLPQVSRGGFSQSSRSEVFGLRYFQPNDFYQQAYRAARYGILYIALTFLTVLLIERRQEKPAHPVQYILIGLAQSLFVLLMVAYAEQIGFGAAYALSAGAVTVLLTAYGITGLRLGRRSFVLGATLAVLYAVLYLILQSEDYALVTGATLAFAALAGTMFATRNEDWYGSDRPKRTPWFAPRPKPPAPSEA